MVQPQEINSQCGGMSIHRQVWWLEIRMKNSMFAKCIKRRWSSDKAGRKYLVSVPITSHPTGRIFPFLLSKHIPPSNIYLIFIITNEYFSITTFNLVYFALFLHYKTKFQILNTEYIRSQDLYEATCTWTWGPWEPLTLFPYLYHKLWQDLIPKSLWLLISLKAQGHKFILPLLNLIFNKSLNPAFGLIFSTIWDGEITVLILHRGQGHCRIQQTVMSMKFIPSTWHSNAYFHFNQTIGNDPRHDSLYERSPCIPSGLGCVWWGF